MPKGGPHLSKCGLVRVLGPCLVVDISPLIVGGYWLQHHHRSIIIILRRDLPIGIVISATVYRICFPKTLLPKQLAAAVGTHARPMKGYHS